MRTALLTAVLGLSLLAAPALASAPTGVDVSKIASHLRAHQKYPASRQQLLDACSDLKDFTDAEKKWFLSTLPDGTYQSADQVLAAITPSSK